MRRLLPLLLVAGLAAGCGASRNATVARVGGTAITQRQVDALVARAREEARNERRDFPAPGSDGYAALRHEALVSLVYRTQVETAAARLGIVVSAAEARRTLGLTAPRHKELPELVFEHAIGALGIEEGKNEESALAIDDARLRLTLAALVRRLGADGVQPWIERAQRSLPARYF